MQIRIKLTVHQFEPIYPIVSTHHRQQQYQKRRLHTMVRVNHPRKTQTTTGEAAPTMTPTRSLLRRILTQPTTLRAMIADRPHHTLRATPTHPTTTINDRRQGIPAAMEEATLRTDLITKHPTALTIHSTDLRLATDIQTTDHQCHHAQLTTIGMTVTATQKDN